MHKQSFSFSFFFFFFCEGRNFFCYWHKFKHITYFVLHLALNSNTVRLFSACLHRHARNCVHCICTQSYTQLLSSDQFNSHKAELTSNPCFLPGAVFTLHLSLWIIGGPAFSLQGSIYIKVLKNKCFKQQVSCYQKHFFLITQNQSDIKKVFNAVSIHFVLTILQPWFGWLPFEKLDLPK